MHSHGGHFFPAKYPESRPHRKCAEMSSEQAHTHERFTTSHVSRTLFAPWVYQKNMKYRLIIYMIYQLTMITLTRIIYDFDAKMQNFRLARNNI